MSLHPLIIEQDAAAVKLAVAVHQNSSLSEIRLVRAKLTAPSRGGGSEEPLAVKFHFRSKRVEAEPRVLRVVVAFKMTGSAAGAESPAVAVESDFEADYVLQEGFELTAEAANAFKDGNAIFNMWPYFREYLQNSLARMGLPPLTAPFLRLQPKPPKVKPGSKAAKAE
jgi:hypothetical protein